MPATDDLVGELRKAGSGAEARNLTVGIIVAIIGAILTAIGLIASYETNNSLNQSTDLCLALLGLALVILGSAIWICHALTRYGRFFLARLIYELRAQTEQLRQEITPSTDAMPGADSVAL